MPEDTTIRDAILEGATGPSEAQEDGLRVKARSLTELIAADKYIKDQEAPAGTRVPFRRFTSTTPGRGEY